MEFPQASTQLQASPDLAYACIWAFRSQAPLFRLQRQCCRHRRYLQQERAFRSPALLWSRRSRCVAASSKGFGKTLQTSETAMVPEPPPSREAAIKQATDNLRNELQRSGKAKGFAGKTGKRLQVDIPMLDETSRAVVELCRDLLKSLPKDLAKQISIVCADIDIALEASSSLANKVFALEDDLSAQQLSPILLLAMPTLAQIEEVQDLLQRCKGSSFILLNAAWTPAQLSPQQRNALQGFRHVYAFVPLGFKGFIKTTEGALVKSGESAWQIYLQEGDKFTCVGRQESRPSETELELAFYNAAAANSPINKGIAGVRSLFGRGKNAEKG